MPTFLMVGKLTKHENQFQDHVYPPSASRVPRTKEDMLRSQLEVEIEQEVTVTRDSVSLSQYPRCCRGFIIADCQLRIGVAV